MKLKHFVQTIIMCVIIVTFISCSKSGSGNQQPPTGGGSNSTTINIYNMAFPSSTTVKKGTVVKWYNQDGYAHTVTSDDGTSFDSGNLAGGATFSYTASTAGTFTYHCNIHASMLGKLVVTQ